MSDTSPDHPMVQYLNSLRTQEDGANPTYVEENRRTFLESLRAQASWFPTDEALRIETKLDVLVAAVANEGLSVDVVLLTGDAGDGKTAVCVKIAKALGIEGDLNEIHHVGAWTIVKDASEIAEERLDQTVQKALESRGQGRKLLVAINEGRLRRLFHPASPAGARFGSLWQSVVEPALAGWIDAAEASAVDAAMRTARVAVVNFRHRMHARTVVPRLLARWTTSALWEDSPACATCRGREHCPILANARDLRRTGVQTRVADVLASAHFSGHRLPFRRLQAVLALCVTGGLRCSDVRVGELAEPSVTSLVRTQYRFYESLFHRESVHPVAVRMEPISSAFSPADANASLDFGVDEEIAALLGHKEPLAAFGEQVPDIEASAIRELRRRMTEPAPSGAPRLAVVDAIAQLTRRLRRWVALTSDGSATAPWRRALGMLEAFACNESDGEVLRRTVVTALNRLHRLRGSNGDALVGRQLDPAAFRNPARLALELDLRVEFKVSLRKGPVLPGLVATWLEGAASEVELEAAPANGQEKARLRLDARLLEALLGVEEGYTSLVALGPYRRELARFHAQLVASAARQVPAHVLLRVADRCYRLETTGAAGQAMLRFEGRE